MSINLGLSRTTRLLGYLGNPHERLRVLHIAGTNGKGSVCSYLSSLLQDRSNQVGKFTTPHLIQITDSITINNDPIPWDAYRRIRGELESLNTTNRLNCTEFELLTCTALKYFHDVKCEWCVIEVGLGGRLDATNVIPGPQKAGCGITKISLDHEAFLGNTLAEIAGEKAGIITEGVKYAVVDGTNDESVLQVVKEKCHEIGCRLIITNPDLTNRQIETKSWGRIVLDKLPLNGGYQISNLRVALAILDHLQENGLVNVSSDAIPARLSSVSWPGRLQQLDYCVDSAAKTTVPVLLDGAHNGSAAIELAKFLRSEYGDQPLTFIMAVTNGKKLDPLLGPLLRSVDRVFVTEYDPVDGMPWIHAMDVQALASEIRKNYTQNVEEVKDLNDILPSVCQDQPARSTPVVVCGSLYLCGDLLRVHKKNLEL